MAEAALAHVKTFKNARRIGAPLVAFKSADPEALIQSLQKGATNGSGIVQWDAIRGMKSRNDAGSASLDYALHSGILDAEAEPGEVEQLMTTDPEQALITAQSLAPDTVLFLINFHLFLDKPNHIQGLCNLRDTYKSSKRTVVIIGPDFTLPAELLQDTLIIDEPLPSPEELEDIVLRMAGAAGVTLPAELVEKSVEALRGLAHFPAEQTVSMCLKRTGVDMDGLRSRKRQLISETEALTVYTGKETFADIYGCDQVKKLLTRILNGKEAPNVIVFMDEGEKSFAGATGGAQDSSGTSQDSLGTTLRNMEDNDSDGVIFVGPPGAAKSAIAKAAGNEGGIPTVILDLGAAKGGIVGESERKIRAAYKVIDAVGGGRAFFIMTCNNDANLPPELKRRFTNGTWYFDLPDEQEKPGIWDLYLKKYNLSRDGLDKVDDTGWTGAEIRNCCRMAYRQGVTVDQAAEFIVPVSRSAPQQIETLRRNASGKYLSANKPGVYEYRKITAADGPAVQQTRRIELED